jgi:peptidoglycan/xylan/chitin deacetylase (PgdA/CDA1 family)
VKRSAKAGLGRLMFASRLGGILLRGTAVIVAFHRVHDAPDRRGLSVSCRMFERYCRFFKRHFRVVALADLVTKLERGEALDRHLAITFDDGYRDNFENAVPILTQLSLPATFFIVSQWIDSDVVPWWDLEHGVRYPWMRWDHVRSLTRLGFHVGAHTRTHVDLGTVTGATAHEEIRGGRVDLEQRLGQAADLFAYPYGGRRNMADENRTLVKAAGFRCCCSCFGGVTGRGADPFQVPRIAVSSWYVSPHQFGLDLVRDATPVFA